jgi:hypothetical protein
MQRPSDGDHFCSTSNIADVHRLGALYLNLSEYVGHGAVERRYLLRESKTNATLKVHSPTLSTFFVSVLTRLHCQLIVEMEYLSGERNYIPPPLPKGEILNGLSGYLKGGLSKSTLTSPHHGHGHRSLNHGIDLYGPYLNQEELELDLFGTRCPNKPLSITSSNRSRSRLAYTCAEEGYHSAECLDSDLEEDSQPDHSNLHDPIAVTPIARTQSQTPVNPTFFDVEKLPMAYGTKTTETMIEAIFNPVKTSEERCESPFTIYVPPPVPTITAVTTTTIVNPSQTNNGSSEYTQARPSSQRQMEVASVYSTESSSTSSGGSASAGSASAHSGQSGTLSRSIHSQISQTSRGSVVSVGGAGEGGGLEKTGGGKVKDWWKKTVGSSRPGTPAGVRT